MCYDYKQSYKQVREQATDLPYGGGCTPRGGGANALRIALLESSRPANVKL